MLDNIRILSGKSLLWDDITQYYKKSIDSEDYHLMHGMDNEKLKKLSSTKPFFSECYVVELHIARVNSKMLNVLMKYMKVGWLKFIFVVQSKDDYELLSTICRKGFNGYKISDKYWMGYVRNRLTDPVQCNLENVYKALAGRFELTDVVIEAINKSNGKCTVASISRMIGKRDRMSLDLVWFNILNCNEKSRKDVFRYLEEYRYGYSFISTSLNNKYEELLKFYKDFHDGRFNDVKFRDYKKETGLSEWVLNSYLEVFSTISFEEILLIGEIIQCSKVDSTASMFAVVGRLYNRHMIEGGYPT